MSSPTEYQEALFRIWAAGTNFELDLQKSVKAEFARLALTRGWKGGDQDWNMHWFMCFGSDYGYGPHCEFGGVSIWPITDGETVAPRVTPVVDGPPNTPIEEDAVDPEQWEFLSRSSESDASGVRIYTPSTVSWEEVEHDDIDGMAAFETHLGDNPHDVAGWQELCAIIGIQLIPESITQCKKARNTVPSSASNTNSCDPGYQIEARQHCQSPQTSLQSASPSRRLSVIPGFSQLHQQEDEQVPEGES
jgi:hypothetical protein